MCDSKPVSTPMDSQLDDIALDGDSCDETLYRQAIGSLMYLMIGTRPDIAFVIGRLSQYMESPTTTLWVCVKRVLRYIRGTREMGIVFEGGDATLARPRGYCDSDWASCKVDRKSTAGYVFLVAGGAGSWKSKKQTVVSTSTAEAEYMAMGAAAQECVWLSRMFEFALGKSELPPMMLHVDNQGSIKMAKNDASSSRTKHIDIKYHLVRDMLQEKKFILQYCPTTEMVADPLTKPVERVLFEKHRSSMGITDYA